MWCNLIFPNISMTSINVRYQTKNKLPRVFFGFLENELCYLTFFSLVWYCSSMIQSSFPQTYWSITKKQIVTLVSSSTFNFTECPVLWTPNPSLMHTALKPHYIERIETCFLIKANYFSTWRTILIYLIWLKPVSI